MAELEQRLRPQRMPRLQAAQVNLSLTCAPKPPSRCNMSEAAFKEAVEVRYSAFVSHEHSC